MKPRESNPARLRLTLSGAAAIHQAVQAAREFAERAELDKVQASRLAIIVEELVANLYDHGGLEREASFTIELGLTAKDLNLVLTDCGMPFDASSAKLDRALPERGGGAGLKLVRAWATETAYGTENGVNRLELRLPRQPNPS